MYHIKSSHCIYCYTKWKWKSWKVTDLWRWFYSWPVGGHAVRDWKTPELMIVTPSLREERGRGGERDEWKSIRTQRIEVRFCQWLIETLSFIFVQYTSIHNTFYPGFHTEGGGPWNFLPRLNPPPPENLKIWIVYTYAWHCGSAPQTSSPPTKKSCMKLLSIMGSYTNLTF